MLKMHSTWYRVFGISISLTICKGLAEENWFDIDFLVDFTRCIGSSSNVHMVYGLVCYAFLSTLGVFLLSAQNSYIASAFARCSTVELIYLIRFVFFSLQKLNNTFANRIQFLFRALSTRK